MAQLTTAPWSIALVPPIGSIQEIRPLVARPVNSGQMEVSTAMVVGPRTCATPASRPVIGVLRLMSLPTPDNRKSAPAARPPESDRPRIHFTPPHMWLNDPNGLVYYRGEYHLFYQHNPADTVWGPMHWGHAVSRDLVNWEHLPIALSPDEHGMIFSGSAVVDWRNSAGFGAEALVAVYTSAQDDRQSQSVAYSLDKGRTWTSYAGNPVVPPPNGIRDFRDPKVFWYGDVASGHWVMAVAAGNAILFFTSPDLLHWVAASGFGFGCGSSQGVWETPDLFELPIGSGPDTRWVLTVGVGDGGPAGGTATQYFVGHFDGRTFTSDHPKEAVLWADMGADFYAAQSWNDAPDGRRIWLGWLSNWRYAREAPTSGWRGAFTFPRELVLQATADGPRLVQQPIAELAMLREGRQSCPAQIVTGTAIVDPTPLQYELNVEFQIPPNSDVDRLGLRLLNGDGPPTVIGYATESSTLYVDRTSCPDLGLKPTFSGTHLAPLDLVSDTLRLQILVDRCSVEVFAEGGRVVITDQIFPCSGPARLEVFADGGPVRVSMLTVEAFRPATFLAPPTAPR